MDSQRPATLDEEVAALALFEAVAAEVGDLGDLLAGIADGEHRAALPPV